MDAQNLVGLLSISQFFFFEGNKNSSIDPPSLLILFVIHFCAFILCQRLSLSVRLVHSLSLPLLHVCLYLSALSSPVWAGLLSVRVYAASDIVWDVSALWFLGLKSLYPPCSCSAFAPLTPPPGTLASVPAYQAQSSSSHSLAFSTYKMFKKKQNSVCRWPWFLYLVMLQ